MRTIAVLNQKGGVGKTTTVANVAAALALNGQRVLVMDLDPQAHLTIHLGADRDAGGGAYDVLVRDVPLDEAVREVRPNLWLLGANIDLVGAESELVSVVGREIILREALEAVREQFDYVLIDCPPSLGLLSLNALAAVREVFIPLLPHFLALQGLGKLLETITLVNRRVNPHLKISGILLCMYDKRTTLSGEVRTDVETFLREARCTQMPWADAQVIPVCIRRNIKLAEAPSYGKTIFEYEPDCNGAIDYRGVAKFVHTQMGSGGVWTLDRQDASGHKADKPDAAADRPSAAGVVTTVENTPTAAPAEQPEPAREAPTAVNDVAAESASKGPERPDSPPPTDRPAAGQTEEKALDTSAETKGSESPAQTSAGAPLQEESKPPVPPAPTPSPRPSGSAPKTYTEVGPAGLASAAQPQPSNPTPDKIALADEEPATGGGESSPSPAESKMPPAAGRIEIRALPAPTPTPALEEKTR